MKIVVTGGAGYIGSMLVEKLAENKSNEIAVFDNFYWGMKKPPYKGMGARNVEWFNEDVTEWSDNLISHIFSADVIFPLAAYVGAPLCSNIDKWPKWTGPTVEKLNRDWFLELISHLHRQLVIYPNTNSGYGSVPDGVCTEDTPSNPLSLYGKTKQDAEEILLKHHYNSIVFRLATVFGWSHRPRIDLLVNSLTYEGLRDQEIKIFQGGFNRNYIHVKDIYKAFIFAIENSGKMAGNVYNLGNDSINMTKLELGRVIANSLGVPLVETQGSDEDKRDYMVSSQKLYGLGYNPEVSLLDGINEMSSHLNYHLEHNPSWIEEQKNY